MYKQLANRYPIISDQIKRPALEMVLSQLEKTLQADTAGDVVEFGCYIGTTSLFIRRLLDAQGSSKLFHAYDSFAGLPAKGAQDASSIGIDFQAGELSVSKKQFLAEFQKARLQTPITHKAWFDELTAAELPEQISFAFLDGDFYDSIIDSLQLVWPRLQAGGIITIDDYQRPALPGVEKAVRDFFQGQPPSLRVSHNIGIIQA